MQKVFAPAVAATVLVLTGLVVAGPTTAPATMPAIKLADAATASGLIDDFVAGRDEAIVAHATPRLKAALEKTPLVDARERTIGSAAQAVGPDTALVTVVRRITGTDGKAYEVVASVADGHLMGLFVRVAQ